MIGISTGGGQRVTQNSCSFLECNPMLLKVEFLLFEVQSHSIFMVQIIYTMFMHSAKGFVVYLEVSLED
jgi:hypothetical protein